MGSPFLSTCHPPVVAAIAVLVTKLPDGNYGLVFGVFKLLPSNCSTVIISLLQTVMCFLCHGIGAGRKSRVATAPW